MRKHILFATVGALALSLAACGDGRDDANMSDNAANMMGDTNDAVGDDTANTGATGNASGTAAVDPNWPRGTRVVQEGSVVYRVNPDGSRVRIEGDDVRIVTEGGVRYRVNRDGTRYRIDERGIDVDIDGPRIPGVDVDVGTNRDGNLDVDISTDGNDATPNR